MHTYLRAVGFLNFSKKEFDSFLYGEAVNHPDHTEVAEDPDGNPIVEFRKEVSDDMGIAMRGYFNDEDDFVLDYYFPYRTALRLSYRDDVVSIVSQSDNNAYYGIIDDVRIGTDLVFFVQDMFSVLNSDLRDFDYAGVEGSSLSALSANGKILLPVEKNENSVQKEKQKSKKRNELRAKAKTGDEDAIQVLAFEDMDLYSSISRRVENEDIYTIVSSALLPSGIESDKYSILADIIDIHQFVNRYTMQVIDVLTVIYNEFIIDIAINEKDLLGVPAIGRRFKGEIWMQGRVMMK